jgi:hypothetical protein
MLIILDVYCAAYILLRRWDGHMTTCIGVDPSLTVCVCVPPHCSMTPDFESLEKELR